MDLRSLTEILYEVDWQVPSIFYDKLYYTQEFFS